MKYWLFKYRWELALMNALIFAVAFAMNAHADCTFKMKPGDITFVQAGHVITRLVEAEEKIPKVTIPAEYLPFPDVEGIEWIKGKYGVYARVCGDWQDVDDELIYGK